MDNSSGDSFVSFIKKAQVKELEELQTQLDAELQKFSAELDQTLTTEKEKISSESRSQERIKNDKQRFERLKSEEFAVLEYQEQLAKTLFYSTIDKKLKNKSYAKKWIDHGLNQIKKLKNGKKQTKLSEPGFVFENDMLVFEYTKSIYFGKIFEQNKTELIKILFNNE